MNITEFAERIVFGKTLEDKLAAPGKLTHDLPSSNLPRVDNLTTPGRSQQLQMHHGRSEKIQPPSDAKLENEQARGQLLHFLANHELLATELMALVLLKFPDAPHAFRRGVLVTLQEEQEHTRMYVRRMQECGVAFGSFPLSGQFWRVVEPMRSPMDFVSRLSLTFEQANLDYSLHFANVFRRLGDDATAGLLQQIYEDEIGHVQHGLHWFRQWKNEDQSDWEAYQAALEFPMSPQRARGPRAAFNRAGREQAGLTADFIDKIEVFRQSRGRPPTVRWFDAGTESELAGEKSAKSLRLMNQLGGDMELVMLPLCREDDVLLVRDIPTEAFRKQLINAGFILPEFIPLSQPESLSDRHLTGVHPWAWTPKNQAIASPLSEKSQEELPTWHESQADLFRKSWAAERLGSWLSASTTNSEKTPDWFTSSESAGISIHTPADLQPALKKVAERGYDFALFKQDFGSSGRGQRRWSTQDPLPASEQTWLQAIANKTATSSHAPLSPQSPIGVIEPELHRVLDISFLWRMGKGAAPEYLGWTRPLIAGRRYVGTRLAMPLKNCEESVRRFLMEDRGRRVEETADWLQNRLAPELSAREFSGRFGVDAMVCRKPDGSHEIKPVVELNPRTTMGHVALELRSKIAPSVQAEFRVLNRTDWQGIRDLFASSPLIVARDGRWQSGAVWLTEVTDETILVPAVFIGSEALEAIRQATGV